MSEHGHGLADDELARWVEAVRADPGPQAATMSVSQLRERSVERAAARPPGPELAKIEDLVIPDQADLAVRLYRPSLQPRPLLVYLHGGGWAIGDLETHDRSCRRIARLADVAVLAVDYRRAPEHPWPAAVDDALAAFRWARDHAALLGVTTTIGVAGDSSGGNLAALCCLRLRDNGEPQPSLQVLLYPNTDLTFSQPSVVEKATGWGLEVDSARRSAERWVPDRARRRDPRVSPLFEPDLRGLAPAVVVTAEHDPLRDEGNEYAAALASAGVEVHHRVETGLVHGFLNLETISPAAAEAVERIAADVAAYLR